MSSTSASRSCRCARRRHDEFAADLCRLHLVSEVQALEAYGLKSRAALRRLVAGSPYIETITILGKHWNLEGPIQCWQPGDDDPNCGALSYRVVKRWRETPTTLMTCYRATRRAHGVFGGQRHRLSTSCAHHLGVSAVYYALKRQSAEAGWQLEDGRFLPMRAKRPDAFLGDVLIDFAGHYGRERVRELIYRVAQDTNCEIHIW